MADALWRPGDTNPEPRFPWWTKHAANGNREIYMAIVSEGGRLMEQSNVGGAIIEGIVWWSAKHRRTFYEDHALGLNDGDHLLARGFVRYAHPGHGGFDTWEEALAWLAKAERP